MDFSVPQTLKDLLADIRQFVESEICPLEAALAAGSFADLLPDLHDKRELVKERGWWAPHVPKEHGGMGLSFMEFAFVGEELGRSPLGHYVFNCQAPDAGNMEILMAFGTVGDPLMDLGTTLGYWVEPTDPEGMRAMAFGPTMLAGNMTRRELVERYQVHTGRDVLNAVFYYCYGLFKIAVIVQQIHARYVRGHTTDERFTQLNQVVAMLGERAAWAIDRETI